MLVCAIVSVSSVSIIPPVAVLVFARIKVLNRGLSSAQIVLSLSSYRPYMNPIQSPSQSQTRKPQLLIVSQNFPPRQAG